MSAGARTFRARAALLCALLAAFGALAACGQQGPLTLPGAEQPPQGNDPPAAAEPAASQPRPEDEEEPIENER